MRLLIAYAAPKQQRFGIWRCFEHQNLDCSVCSPTTCRSFIQRDCLDEGIHTSWETFTTLALLLRRCRVIVIFFFAGLENLLKLTSKLCVQLLESSQILFCVGSSSHLCKEHPPILIGLGHIRFQLDSHTVMFKRLRIVLCALLPKRESEVIMRLSTVRIIADRLFELQLRRGELLPVHQIDSLLVNFVGRTTNLLSQRVVLS